MATDGDKIAAAILAAKSNTGDTSPDAYVGLYFHLLAKIVRGKKQKKAAS
jgi:hypothetical protein